MERHFPILPLFVPHFKERVPEWAVHLSVTAIFNQHIDIQAWSQSLANSVSLSGLLGAESVRKTYAQAHKPWMMASSPWQRPSGALLVDSPLLSLDFQASIDLA